MISKFISVLACVDKNTAFKMYLLIEIRIWKNLITSSPGPAPLIGTTETVKLLSGCRMVNGVVKHGSVPLY